MNYGKKGIKKRQQDINARGPKWSRKLLLWMLEILIVLIIGVGLIVGSLGIGVFKSILSTSPDISKITVTPTGRSSFVYNAQGQQIDKLVSANANRIPVTYDKIPINLEHAFVAIEDQRFYEHNGIDIQSIINAGLQAVMKGRLGKGASTITQQLLKNNVFTDWATEENDVEKVKRKIQEQFLAIQLEKNMSKEDILTNYLNTINLGHSTLGVQAASLRYFNKNCSELTLSECAVIAGITQNPSRYDPLVHPDYNAERRELVLDLMLEQGYITEAEYQTAMADDPYSRLTETNQVEGEAAVTSYFVDALIEQVTKDLKNEGYTSNQVFTLLYSGGLKIMSTQDPEIQAICDEVFANEENYPANTRYLLEYRMSVNKADGTTEHHSNEKFMAHFKSQNPKFNMLYKSTEAAYEGIAQYQADVLEEGDEIIAEDINITPQPQISFTVEDQTTGYVVAMIGGRGSKDRSRSFNRATQSVRQPGSCFKVLSTFAPALDSCGMTLATTYNDAPFNYYNGTPVSNWYGKDTYYGLCSIRYGVYWSLNVVAVKTLTEITPQLGYNYLVNFGISTLEEGKAIGNQVFTDIGQPLALGGITNGVYNYELNAAYASIANGGVYVEPKLYTKILDSDGNVILDNSKPVSRTTVSPQTAYLLTSAMQDCVNIGTGTRAKFKGMSIAGKTGTTSSGVDVWFAGYTPYYTATCWAGYDNNQPLADEEQRLPQLMFRRVMEQVHEELPDIGFEMPDGIVRETICSKSGLLPTPGLCDAHLKSEYFAKDTVPTESCNVHIMGNICGYDNLPAADQCPFAYFGATEVIPPEHESLWQGSLVVTDTLDPLATGGQASANTGHCQHDEVFFSQPDWEYKLQLQQAEYASRFAALNPEPVVPAE